MARRRASKALGVSILALTLASSGFAIATGNSQDQQQKPASGAISGMVVDATTGAPIAGATVSLTMRRPGALFPTEVGGVLTDARGRFVFVELEPAETYRARVSKIGLLEFSWPTNIAIDAGAWTRDVEFPLTPAGQIDGLVTFENGDPAAGVRVRLWQQLWAAGRRRLMEAATAEANDLGAFVFPDLDSGRYLVCVSAERPAVPSDLLADAVARADQEQVARSLENGMRPLASMVDAPFLDASTVKLLLDPALPTTVSVAGPSLTYASVCEPGPPGATSDAVVVLSPGGSRSLELQLRAVPAFAVSGVVVGGDGSYAGLPLRLYVAEGGEALFSGGQDVATTLVDHSGRFVFANVPAGRYTIEPADTLARYFAVGAQSGYDRTPPPGWEGQSYARSADSGVNFEVQRSRDRWGWGRTIVDVARDVDSVELAIAPLGSLRGRVAWPSGAELTRRGVSVNLESTLGDPALGLPSGRIRPDDVAGGVIDFEISGVRAGSYILRPNPPPGWAVRSILHQGEDWMDRPVIVQAGDQFDDVVIELTNELPTLSGFIAEAAEPGARVTVIAFPSDRGLWRNQGRRAPRFLRASARLTGQYLMPEFQAGRYYIAAIEGELPQQWQAPEFLERLAASAVEREIDWGENMVLDLTAREVR